MSKMTLTAVCLALMLTLSLAGGALAQCGGGSGYMHNQHMGNSGHMGIYGNQSTVQTDPNAGYATPAPSDPYYSGTTQDAGNSGSMMGSGGSGQMMGQGGMGSGHQGHMGH